MTSRKISRSMSVTMKSTPSASSGCVSANSSRKFNQGVVSTDTASSSSLSFVFYCCVLVCSCGQESQGGPSSRTRTYTIYAHEHVPAWPRRKCFHMCAMRLLAGQGNVILLRNSCRFVWTETSLACSRCIHTERFRSGNILCRDSCNK